MNRQMRNRVTPRRGFTLVELLVTISIIAVLMGLTFVVFRAGQDAADHLTEDVELALIKLEKKALPPPKSKAATPIPNQFLFVFGPGVTDAQAEVDRLSHVATFRVIHVYNGTNLKGFSATLSAQDMQTVLRDRAIKGAEQDHKVNVLGQVVPRGVKRMSVDLTYSGMRNGAPAPASKAGVSASHPPWSGVVVAVLDTGVDAKHPDLNVVHSHGFVDGDVRDVADLHGQAHVAGTIGAFDNQTGVVGVAPAVQIYNLKILDEDGSGNYSDMVAALNWVQAHASKIHVANMSLGGPHSRTVNSAVDACVDAGVVMVVAAGNEAEQAKGSPASASEAIAVGALADSDGLAGGKGSPSSFGKDDSFASFSNYGKAVKFLAPGVNILSTLPLKRGGHGVMSGTSMASPHVAGLAARIHNASLDPDAPGASTYFAGRSSNTRATPSEILQVLKKSAKETIPGRFDPDRQYPLINAKGL